MATKLGLVGLSAAAMMATGIAIPAPVGAQGGDVASALAKCGAILDDAKRHDCTDAVMRDAGMLPSAAARTTEQRKKFGLTRPVAPPKPAPVETAVAKPAKGAKPAKVAKAKPAKPPRPAEDDSRIKVTLTRVEQAGDKLELTTSEGAVWRQGESEMISPLPAAGQSMTVEKTALGGFRCITGKWTVFRCARVR